MQGGWVGKVVLQTRAEIDCLAHVDHVAIDIPEPVDPGFCRDIVGPVQHSGDRDGVAVDRQRRFRESLKGRALDDRAVGRSEQ